MTPFNPNSFNPQTVGYPQSDILAVADFVRPDFQTKLFLKHGDQFLKDFLFCFAMSGKKGTQNAMGGFHFEEDRYDDYVEVLADAGTGANTLVITQQPSQFFTQSGEYSSYPVETQHIWDTETNTMGRITNIAVVPGVSITITAVRLSGPAWTTPTPGKKYALPTNSQPENSLNPEAQNSYWTKETYELQVLRTTAMTTDLALGDKLYPETDEQGNFVGNWGNVSVTQNEFRYLKSVFGALILGQTNATAGQPSTTEGIYNAFSAGANTVDVLTGNYLDHLYSTIDLLKENSPMSNSYVGLICRNIIKQYESDLRAVYPDSNINAVKNMESDFIYGGNATLGQNLRMDIQMAILAGFNMYNKSFDVSYDPNVFGLNAKENKNLFSNTAYWIQTSPTQDAEGNSAWPLQMRYLEQPGVGGNPRSMKITQNGMFANSGDPRQANRETYFYGCWGFEYFNLKQQGFWYKSALS